MATTLRTTLRTTTSCLSQTRWTTWTPSRTWTCTTRSTEHTARRSLMHNCVTSHLWLKSALHASSHPCMCTCVLRLGCFLSSVLYFVPPFSFQSFLMFTSEFNERSRSNPLSDFRLGTVATSNHETPLTVVESFCLPNHNIVPHICWHDPPYRRTTKKYDDFPNMVVFQFLPRKFVIQTWLCNCPQYLCLFHMVFASIRGIHVIRKMLVLPNQLLYWVLSTSDQCLVSFQRVWCHPFAQIRKTLFDVARKSILNWKLSPNRTAKRYSQIAFPITVLPKDDRTDSAQEEQLGLPYWTMVWAICVVVDESTCLDIPILEFSIILEHLPFLPGYKQRLRLLLVLRNPAVWRWYPWLLLLSSVMLMILVQWILHKNLNHLWQYHLGVQLYVFLVPCLQFSIFKWQMSTSAAKWTFAPFVLASSITSDSFLTFVRFHAEISSNLSPFLVHCCLCCRNFHGLGHGKRFVYQMVMFLWIVSFSCNMVFMMSRQWFSHTQSCRFTSFQNTRKFWFDLIGFTTTPTILTVLNNFARQSGSHRCLQILASILDDLLKFLVLRVNEIDSS